MMSTGYLLLVLLVIQCTTAQKAAKEESEVPDLRIINGQDADKGEYPFMVRLMEPDGYHFCGGSLLTPRIVLTAAHCVYLDGALFPLTMTRAVVGDHTSSATEDNERVLEGIRVIAHEKYNEDTIGVGYVPTNDVALIVLKEEVELKDGAVSTITLPKDDSVYSAGADVTVIGWGLASDGAKEVEDMDVADTLQELEYKIADKEKCIQYWKDIFETEKDEYGLVSDDYPSLDDVAEGMFCTIGKGSSFYGDSGGPLIVKTGSEFTQIGLVSWGTGNPKEITYNVAMNLRYYADWIEAAMKRANEDSWLELSTGGSHGMVLVHDLKGNVNTICNDNVGNNEINAICRERGFKMGTLADAWDYLARRDPQVPSYAYTNLRCPSESKSVTADCKMDKYSDSKVPCFNGEQLAVRCSNEVWSFKVTHMVNSFKTVKGSSNVRGRVECAVDARKYNFYMDVNSQVKVRLVTRGQQSVEEVGAKTKYKWRNNKYVTRVRPADKVQADGCFACIAYVPGTKFYAVGKRGPDSCPDNESHYQTWIASQSY